MLEQIKVCLVAPVPEESKGFILNKVRCGGISTWTKQVLGYLKQNPDNIEVTYVDIFTKKRSVDGKKNRLISRIINGIKSSKSAKKELKSIVKLYKPNLIHMTTSGSLGFLRDICILKYCKKIGIPTIVHMRFGRIPSIMSRKNGIENRLLDRVISLSDRVIVLDSNSYYSLKKKYGEKICLVPNFASIPQIQTPSIRKNIVTFVGWVKKEKGIEELLLAWKKIVNKYNDWHLNIIGPYNQAYFDSLKCISTKQCSFLGELNHNAVLNSINEGKIFVLPSYTEGFPNSVVEAMSLKQAIVSTNVGAIKEMLDPNCGIVIEPKNVEELYNALESLMSNEEKIRFLSQSAYNKFIDNYTIDIIMSKYIDIWRKLINDSFKGDK